MLGALAAGTSPHAKQTVPSDGPRHGSKSKRLQAVHCIGKSRSAMSHIWIETRHGRIGLIQQEGARQPDGHRERGDLPCTVLEVCEQTNVERGEYHGMNEHLA